MATKKKTTVALTVQLTPQQYSDMRGYKNAVYVNRQLANGNLELLPNVVTSNKFGRFRTVTVKSLPNGLPDVPTMTDAELAANENRSKVKLAAQYQ